MRYCCGIDLLSEYVSVICIVFSTVLCCLIFQAHITRSMPQREIQIQKSRLESLSYGPVYDILSILKHSGSGVASITTYMYVSSAIVSCQVGDTRTSSSGTDIYNRCSPRTDVSHHPGNCKLFSIPRWRQETYSGFAMAMTTMARTRIWWWRLLEHKLELGSQCVSYISYQD
jgi:hypothetical protein